MKKYDSITQLNIHQASFPFVNFYTMTEEKTIEFLYQKHISENKLVFQVEESLTKIKCILKFVTSSDHIHFVH